MITFILSLFLFFVSFLTAQVLIPLVQAISRAFKLYDQPSVRKIHQQPISRLGGVAIVASVLISTLLLWLIDDAFMVSNRWMSSIWTIAAVGGGLTALLGIVDDLMGLNARSKLVAQILIAALVIPLGFRIETLALHFGGPALELGWASVPFTMLWIVGCMNAVNLIDGIDGLVGGLALITLSGLALISSLFGFSDAAFVSVMVAGATAAFLAFNFNPASIFLGDTGSLFLGFLLSYLPVAVLNSRPGTDGPEPLTLHSGVVLILFIPFLDMGLAMIRRSVRYWWGPEATPGTKTARLVFRSLEHMFKPDLNHIHHELLARGIRQRKAVVILYCLQLTFFVIGMGIFFSRGVMTFIFLTVFAALTVIFLRSIHLREVGELFGLLRPTLRLSPPDSLEEKKGAA